MDTSWQILVFGQKNGLMRQAFRLVPSWPWRWQGRGVVPWVPDWRIWRDEWLLIEGEISINVYEHLWKYLLIPYHTEEKYLWTYLLMIMMIILMSAGFLGSMDTVWFAKWSSFPLSAGEPPCFFTKSTFFGPRLLGSHSFSHHLLIIFQVFPDPSFSPRNSIFPILSPGIPSCAFFPRRRLQRLELGPLGVVAVSAEGPSWPRNQGLGRLSEAQYLGLWWFNGAFHRDTPNGW